ncbi:helix-turn-helix domain-containing protein [Teredinibacter turnerae]|uniref:helix-turn-helix domain-containing protein n=1 Tax=Teredinibacter turnerae TaxID=2426 RepID=UPI00035D623B|nr:helix-turn-helix domain-containing protein [Teredinibacter turnerae]
MTHLFILSGISLLLKLLTLLQFRKCFRTFPVCIFLIAFSFIAMNLCELCFQHVLLEQDGGYTVVTLYYVFSLLGIYAVLSYAMQFSPHFQPWWQIITIGLLLAPQIFVLLTGTGITTIVRWDDSFTQLSGSYFFVVQLGYYLQPLVIATVLLYTQASSKSHNLRLRVKSLLLALLPLLAAAPGIVNLFTSSLPIYVSGITSILFTITLWLVCFTHTEKNQFLLMSYVPLSRENRILRALAETVAQPDRGLRRVLQEYETQILNETLAKTDGNITHAAKILKIGRSTLSQKMSKQECQSPEEPS